MEDDSRLATTVAEVWPSANWQNADVVYTACGHRHVRPKGAYVVGQSFECPFDHDADGRARGRTSEKWERLE